MRNADVPVARSGMERAVAKDRARGLSIHPEYGTQADNKGYLRRKHRQRAGLLNQFLATDGPKGATDAYRDEHQRLFGLTERERKAEARLIMEELVEWQRRVHLHDGPQPIDETVAGQAAYNPVGGRRKVRNG